MARYTDDPIADFNDHDASVSKWLSSRPICDMCGEHIQDDYLFEINGELICEDCLKTYHRKHVEDYMEG